MILEKVLFQRGLGYIALDIMKRILISQIQVNGKHRHIDRRIEQMLKGKRHCI